jgi:hypothetical protein
MTGRRLLAVSAFVLAGLGPLSAQAQPHAATTLTLPVPTTSLKTFPNIGLRPDRRLVSHVPSTVSTREDVAVAVDGSGTPAAVELDEHLHVDGTGAYLIYERGPARAAAPLDGSLPPVLELGTVVWQGFSPGGRDLAAHLKLDATLEAQRLPVRTQLSFRPASGGRERPLGANGAAPGAGTVFLRLTNTTSTPRVVPTGAGATAPVADALTTLLAAARRSDAHPSTAYPLPVAGRGLPREVPATDVASTAAFVPAPMRVVGSLTAPGTSAALSGPTVSAAASGGHFNGILTDSVTFELAVQQATRVALDLVATPTLDERTLQPPSGTWQQWAQRARTTAERQQATAQLVAGAAASARGAELSPYVGSDTVGPASTRFRYTISPVAAKPRAVKALHPHPLAISLVSVLALALLSGAAVVWRRS